MRHILEFYQCFLDGLAAGCIDYDARKRNQLIQESREYAIEAVRNVIRRLESCDELARASVLWVRMEDMSDDDVNEPFLASSIERELQVLSSHMIHHFALIAMTLAAHGLNVDKDFGMAPSTLRHLALIKESQQPVGVSACAR